MPYIDVKCHPRPEEKINLIVEKINQVLIDEWGCPQHTISISLEQVPPEEWHDKVEAAEMDPRADSMFILHGEKKF
ncbi:MAG: tautomerase family protein [Atopobiaceae bacterium]|nr:tautomerase family protein [Atopobiaceae bacterium]MBQ3283112.1 tautomerase family protein [Atopobiaceae bacterium]MBQ6410901.1 tautomerase family protein [Atopobiaceae bacterium]